MPLPERDSFYRKLAAQVIRHRDQQRLGGPSPPRPGGRGSLPAIVRAQLRRLRAGGQEHDVAFPTPEDGWERVVKVRRRTGHEMQSDSRAYAERMAMANLHLGDDVRIEGADRDGRMVISQPFYDAEGEEGMGGDEMRQARVAAMAELGFAPDDIPGDPPGASGAYRKPGYAILDAVWHNFIYRRQEGGTVAIPFDLQILRDIAGSGLGGDEFDRGAAPGLDLGEDIIL